jgi:hypothetical protein
MDYEGAMAALLGMVGGPVCITVAEVGGAGAQVANFSGVLSAGDVENPGTDDERMVLSLGGDEPHASFTIERTLADEAEPTAYGLLLSQASLYLMIEDLARFPASPDAR